LTGRRLAVLCVGDQRGWSGLSDDVEFMTMRARAKLIIIVSGLVVQLIVEGVDPTPLHPRHCQSRNYDRGLGMGTQAYHGQ